MNGLKLIIPTEELAQEMTLYRKAFLDAGDTLCGCASLAKYEDISDWFAQIHKLSNDATVPDGWVRSTQFVYIRESDGKVVGTLQVRHRFNEFLEKFGGNIGYSVRPDERRRGYASAMLRESLDFCRSVGLDRVLITCSPDNEGSRRTILSCGGEYESTVFCARNSEYLERYFIDITK